MSRTPRQRTGTLWRTGTAWIAVFAAIAWFAQTTTAVDLDRTVMQSLTELRTTSANEFFLWLSATLRPKFLAPATLAIALLLWFQLRRAALVVPVSFASSIAMTYLVKWGVDKPRPSESFSLVDVPDAAFPSAHVAGVTSVGLALWQVWLPRLRRGIRRLLRVAVVLLIGAVALARMWVGAHWLTDVIGGLAVAVLGAWLALALLRPQTGRRLLRGAYLGG